MTDTWTEAQAKGVLVVPGMGWTDDGDAYTVKGVSRPVPTGRPVLTSIVPETLPVDPPDIFLTCIGTGFTRDCYIRFAGQSERTDFINDTELRTVIKGEYWQAPATVAVTVYSEDRGSSDALPFIFTAAEREDDAVPEGSVAEVLAWVGHDPQRAAQALDAERAGQNRSTLIAQLGDIA
jgi:IPT/TIG domain-containing protein